jgi:hypothetical protein
MRKNMVVYFLDGPLTAGGWYSRRKNELGEFVRSNALEHVSRHSLFDAYVVVMNATTHRYFALQRVRWTLDLDLGIDPAQPPESRVDGKQATITILAVQAEGVEGPEPELLTGPTARNSKTVKTVKKDR